MTPETRSMISLCLNFILIIGMIYLAFRKKVNQINSGAIDNAHKSSSLSTENLQSVDQWKKIQLDIFENKREKDREADKIMIDQLTEILRKTNESMIFITEGLLKRSERERANHEYCSEFIMELVSKQLISREKADEYYKGYRELNKETFEKIDDFMDRFEAMMVFSQVKKENKERRG